MKDASMRSWILKRETAKENKPHTEVCKRTSFFVMRTKRKHSLFQTVLSVMEGDDYCCGSAGSSFSEESAFSSLWLRRSMNSSPVIVSF